MKCPMCNGSGKCYEQKIRYQEIETNRTDFTLAKCHKCNGSGEVQMTNEEYLRSCNTEQLAEWIAKQKCDGCNDEPYDDKHGTCKYCMAKKTEQIREWLKEKHE